MTQPLTFENFIKSLFSIPEIFPFDFKNRLKDISDKTVQEFVENLLNFLSEQSEDYSTFENHFTDGSFFDFLQKNIDIEDLPEHKENQEYFWNESVKSLIDFFNKHYNEELVEETTNYLERSEVVNGKIPIDQEKSFNSKDIKNADAGYLFGKINEIAWTQLVRPWYNIDWDSYYKVRGRIDNFAANSQKNLTFTREQYTEQEQQDLINRWIRLIMPNNSRRVAVEDLNRNFWVISSVTQAVCSYLWGDYAPLPYLLKGILNELVQLWENIMYLWVAFNMISQKGGRGIKTIIMPLPRTNLQPYRKYDDFISGFPNNLEDQKEFVLERVMPIIQKYKYTNLCILPYTRNDNYYYNHYAAETYRGVVFYNCRTEKITYVPFYASEDGRTPSYSVYFNPDNFREKLYAIRETDTYYKWTYPVDNVKNLVNIEGTNYLPKKFYGAFRIIPEIEVGYVGEWLAIKKIKLTAIDAAAKSLFNQERKFISYSTNIPITEDNTDSAILTLIYEENDSDQLGNFDIYEGVVDQAYYLGEIPSCYGITRTQPYFEYDHDVKVVGEGKLIKIGNYLPKTFYTGGYYEKEHFYGEQITPDGHGTTDYLLNLTITGGRTQSDKDTVKKIYGNYGSNHVVSAGNCFFFKPKITVEAGPPSYSLICDEKAPSEMNEALYKQTGIEVISDYIKKVETPQAITYYIAGVGIQPWHNKPSNDTFQGYWTTTVLTHMYRFVPMVYDYLLSDADKAAAKIVLNELQQSLGYLQVLGTLDKREAAFSVDGGDPNDTFSKDGNITTWRLPQLIPEIRAQNYLILSDQTSGGLLYFVDLETCPELKQIFERSGGEGVAIAINENYGKYEKYLITSKDFQFELQNPSGRWCVFDGNTNYGYANNKDTYKKQENRREVTYTTFVYDNGKFLLSSPTKGRKKDKTSWSDCKASYILPKGGFNDMKFNW